MALAIQLHGHCILLFHFIEMTWWSMDLLLFINQWTPQNLDDFLFAKLDFLLGSD
jgi:hypothetical protein